MLVILPVFLVFILIAMVPGLLAMVICRSIRQRGLWNGIPDRLR